MIFVVGDKYVELAFNVDFKIFSYFHKSSLRTVLRSSGWGCKYRPTCPSNPWANRKMNWIIRKTTRAHHNWCQVLCSRGARRSSCQEEFLLLHLVRGWETPRSVKTMSTCWDFYQKLLSTMSTGYNDSNFQGPGDWRRKGRRRKYRPSRKMSQELQELSYMYIRAVWKKSKL